MGKKTYSGTHADVSFDLDTCIHAGECVRGLPKVFEVGRKPWILPDEASLEELKDVVSRCPSGALELHEKGAAAEAEAVTITAMEGGPFVISGAVCLVDADGKVIKEAKKMALCHCGKSGNGPFCDGSHAR